MCQIKMKLIILDTKLGSVQQALLFSISLPDITNFIPIQQGQLTSILDKYNILYNEWQN